MHAARIRFLAFQILSQLPEDVTDARAVLECATRILMRPADDDVKPATLVS